MAHVISEDPAEVPVREDGQSFRHVLVLACGQAVFADDLHELTGAIIDGYPEGIDAGLEVRLESLAQIAGQSQALVMAAADTGFDEDELTALLADKADTALELESWNSPTPLFLMATNYAPFRPFSRPAGNIAWVDPSNERTYLNSLAVLGVGELHELPA